MSFRDTDNNGGGGGGGTLTADSFLKVDTVATGAPDSAITMSADTGMFFLPGTTSDEAAMRQTASMQYAFGAGNPIISASEIYWSNVPIPPGFTGFTIDYEIRITDLSGTNTLILDIPQIVLVGGDPADDSDTDFDDAIITGIDLDIVTQPGSVLTTAGGFYCVYAFVTVNVS